MPVDRFRRLPPPPPYYFYTRNKNHNINNFHRTSLLFISPVKAGLYFNTGNEKMKTLYIILFLMGTLALVLLSYWFLELLDDRAAFLPLSAIVAGMALCVSLMVYFLYRYLKLPAESKH